MPKYDMYTGGVSSLIGVSSGISLDGESVRLPGDEGFDINDDISSINDGSSYYPHSLYQGSQSNQIKIVGTAESMEEGHNMKDNNLSPASLPLSDQMRKADERTAKGQKQEKAAHGVPLGSEDSTDKTPPNMKKTSKISINGRKRKRNGCVPKWVNDAPRWLKFVIAFSTALLVGAVVLVTVALATALAGDDDGSNTSANLSSTSAPGESTGGSAQDPWNDENTGGMSSPTDDLVIESTPVPEITDTEGTDASQPTSTSNLGDNNSPATSPTNSSSSPNFDSGVTTFFVTGGRFTNDALDRVPGQLSTLPVRGGTSFLVHLGDWNSPYATGCDEQSYQDVNDLFSNSSIPVYFVPGDNDFNDCPNPERAMSLWEEYLLGYETQHWEDPSAWSVARDEENEYPENFAFVYNEILFVGINLVGGVVHDSREWAERQAANLEWIDVNFQQYKDTFKAFVLFAHADPDVPSNSPFYEPFKDKVRSDYNQVPVVLIHRNLGVEPWSWETEFENIDNFSVVVVAGSTWPPLMGAVDFRQNDPFIFDQSNWYSEYIQHERKRGASRG